MEKYVFLTFLIISILLVIPSQTNSEVFKFYGRGHVDPADPIFGDEFLRTIIKGDKGAIIDVVSHFGIVVIRLDLIPDPNCNSNELIVCFTGKVSKLRNVDHPNVGSEISLKINMQEGTEELTIHSGNMAGTNVLIFLENIGEKNHQRGNLRIQWDSCKVEFDKTSGLPKTLAVIPLVMDELNNLINSEIKSKFRFSYDKKVEETSHVHLDYRIIDEFIISALNPSSLILNLTKAFSDMENPSESPIQIEARHYTIFPLNENEPPSYSNKDQVLLEFNFNDGRWTPEKVLCSSLEQK